MTDKKTNRRKLLKSIAAGSGAVVAGTSLPESWSKPVVDAVMLPVHAATTDETGKEPEVTIAPTTTPDPCCEGVFCNIEFDGPFGGSAAVSGCNVNMTGDSEWGLWSGSGSVATDGSFSFSASFEQESIAQITGTTDCNTINGQIIGFGTTFGFTGSVTPGITSIGACPSPR